MKTFVPSASLPTSATTGPHRPFLPEPGSYDAVVAAAAVLYALQDLDAALPGAIPLLVSRLEAAHACLDAALAAWMKGFPC